MAGNVHEAPRYSRRVYNAEELVAAISEAIRAAGVAGADIDFNGVVRLEQDEPLSGRTTPFILTIIKRA
jgi:hypothetical protein